MCRSRPRFHSPPFAFPLVPTSSSGTRTDHQRRRKLRRRGLESIACRTKRTVQRLTSINTERDARTHIAGENPALALSLCDCLVCNDCDGAARTTGSKKAVGIRDSMDMIVKRWGTNCEGPSARSPQNTLGPSACFVATCRSRINLGLFAHAHAPTSCIPLKTVRVRVYPNYHKDSKPKENPTEG